MKKLINALYWLMKWHKPTLRYFFGMGSFLGKWHWELNTPKDHWVRNLRSLNDD